MTLRKLADEPPPPCRHPEHSTPMHMVLEPGMYEHECPGCGRTERFRVNRSVSAGAEGVARTDRVIVGSSR